MSKSLEVPITWLEGLVEMGNRVSQRNDDLPMLLGYIKSAEYMIKPDPVESVQTLPPITIKGKSKS